MVSPSILLVSTCTEGFVTDLLEVRNLTLGRVRDFFIGWVSAADGFDVAECGEAFDALSLSSCLA